MSLVTSSPTNIVLPRETWQVSMRLGRSCRRVAIPNNSPPVVGHGEPDRDRALGAARCGQRPLPKRTSSPLLVLAAWKISRKDEGGGMRDEQMSLVTSSPTIERSKKKWASQARHKLVPHIGPSLSRNVVPAKKFFAGGSGFWMRLRSERVGYLVGVIRKNCLRDGGLKW